MSNFVNPDVQDAVAQSSNVQPVDKEKYLVIPELDRYLLSNGNPFNLFMTDEEEKSFYRSGVVDGGSSQGPSGDQSGPSGNPQSGGDFERIIDFFVWLLHMTGLYDVDGSIGRGLEQDKEYP